MTRRDYLVITLVLCASVYVSYQSAKLPALAKTEESLAAQEQHTAYWAGVRAVSDYLFCQSMGHEMPIGPSPFVELVWQYREEYLARDFNSTDCQNLTDWYTKKVIPPPQGAVHDPVPTLSHRPEASMSRRCYRITPAGHDEIDCDTSGHAHPRVLKPFIPHDAF